MNGNTVQIIVDSIVRTAKGVRQFVRGSYRDAENENKGQAGVRNLKPEARSNRLTNGT